MSCRSLPPQQSIIPGYIFRNDKSIMQTTTGLPCYFYSPWCYLPQCEQFGASTSSVCFNQSSITQRLSGCFRKKILRLFREHFSWICFSTLYFQLSLSS